MTAKEYRAKYDRMAHMAMARVNNPIPKQCRSCRKNCDRRRYALGGCHAFTFRPADDGACWGWAGKEREVR